LTIRRDLNRATSRTPLLTISGSFPDGSMTACRCARTRAG